MDKQVGTCSLCGGRVMVPTMWNAVVPPVPTCERCHATARQPDMPVVQMEPRRSSSRLDDDSNPMHQFGYGRGDNK